MTGHDSFGEDIYQALKACGVNVSGIKKTSKQHTTLAFVSLKEAKMAGCLISYDPNYREKLWGGREDAIPEMKSIFKFADIVKVSDEELSLLYGSEISYEDGAKK